MRRTVHLSDQERQALQELVRCGTPAYLRERAACILKVAEGQVAAQVARSGLLRPRDPDTIYAWLDRFQEERLAGLPIRPGRGRKPALAPQEATQAQEELRGLLYDDPRQHQQDQTRWTLEAIREVCVWLQRYSVPGVWRILDRLGLHYKRAREHLHSPDAHYQAKLEWQALLGSLAQAKPQEHVLLYLDEFTYYLQPTLAHAYALQGADPVLSERSYRSNIPWRVVAAMNALNGEVLYEQAYHIRVSTLVDFYVRLCAHYPGAQLWVVQDNWPVPFHPDLLAALEKQETPFAWPRPRSWGPEAHPTARHLDLPVQLVPLPTYAPWTNPIEKLWRWLKQAVLHLHRWANDPPELRHQVDLFLSQFQQPSESLLRYTGLLVPT